MMFSKLKFLGMWRDWRRTTAAGVLGFAIAFAVMAIIDAYAVTLTSLAVAMAAVLGALSATVLVGSSLASRMRWKLSEQNMRLDAALNNMNQGLCMFDAQARLVVWNERYRAMYNIDPQRIRRGATIHELLDARIAAGSFALEPVHYVTELRDAVKRRKTFTMTVEMSDGRIIAVVNQPMPDGGWVATHEDITEQRRAERDLERTRSFLDTIIENVPSPIIVKDIPSLHYLLINRAAEQFLGIDRSTMIGRTATEVLPEGTAAAVEAEDRRLIAAGQTIFLDEHAVITPANGARIVTSTRLPVRNANGQPQYLISVIHDVTERKRDEQKLAHMAHHDPLTELPNRAAFNECIAATLELAAASRESFAVLCTDIDGFKTVNDVFGHSFGDALLREVSRRMEAASAGAFLARIGGDEFAIVTPTGPQPQAAAGLTERLGAAFASDIELGGQPVRVSLTVGVSIFPQDGADATALVANADAALFRAKTEARGSIRFFEKAMDRQLREKRALQQDLRSAIARNEIVLHYQPQALIGGEITGFEALVRWRHPRHGLVPPSTFIPLAEESGSIMALGEWILRTACREAASWPRPLRIGINLSPLQFQHGDLPRLVHQVLLETGLVPSRLELEITEGVLIGDFTRTLGILRRLKSLGVRIAMDDFGTGYSSLSYLQSFPFDKMKIDRAFIANLGQSEQAATIIRAVIALGRGLDLPVVAEGVETEEQVQFLAREHCTEIQGFYVGRPMPIADYAEAVGRAPAQGGQGAKPAVAAG